MHVSGVMNAIGEATGGVMSAIGEATGMKPGDDVIAVGALMAAKMKAQMYCLCLLEATHPEVRHLLQTHLQDAISEHERWTKLVVGRGWYKAEAPAQELLRQAVQQALPALQ